MWERRRLKLFGSRRRTEVLLGVALLGETYARELARLLNAPLLSVQRVVDALDEEGVVAVRSFGKERRVTLNPRFFAIAELRALLLRLAEGETEIQQAVSSLRRSPRRKGKEL